LPLGSHALDACLVDDALTLQAGGENLDRVARGPRLPFRHRLVGARVPPRMAGLPIGKKLEKDRAAALPASRRRGLGGRADGLDVIAVDGLARESIGGRSIGDARILHHEVDAGRGAVEIVLADEDDRQLPDRGEVERLVKGAFVVRAVAEERHRHRAGPPLLGAQRGADRDRQPAANDAIRAEIALGRVGDVHRAAASLAISAFAPEELGEHRLEFSPFGDAMTVAAMGRGDPVGVAERHARSDRRRLLSDRQVHRAVTQAADIRVFRRLLETADAMHAPERAEDVFHAQTVINFRTRDTEARGLWMWRQLDGLQQPCPDDLVF
jgi:hypothetical protein